MEQAERPVPRIAEPFPNIQAGGSASGAGSIKNGGPGAYQSGPACAGRGIYSEPVRSTSIGPALQFDGRERLLIRPARSVGPIGPKHPYLSPLHDDQQNGRNHCRLCRWRIGEHFRIDRSGRNVRRERIEQAAESRLGGFLAPPRDDFLFCGHRKKSFKMSIGRLLS